MSYKKNNDFSKINNSKQEDKMEIDDVGGDESLQRNNDYSDDLINQKHKYMGNKVRQNTGKIKRQQISLSETTCFTRKDHVLINEENSQITKQLELNNQFGNNINYNYLFLRAINYSIDNICEFINIKVDSIYALDFSYIYLKKIIEININNYEEFLESTIKDIYLGKFLKLNHGETDKIKAWINILLNAEIKKEKGKFKLFNTLFSKKIKDILLLYINDEAYIQQNNTKFYLRGFNTLIDDFNEYSTEQRQQIKEYIYALLGNITIHINNE